MNQTATRGQTFPINGATSGTLVFTRDASNVNVRATPERDHLCRLAFSGWTPKITADGGHVQVTYPRAIHPFDWHKDGVTATLTEALPWRLEVGGGIAHLRADLASLRVDGIAVHGGASDVRLALPAPRGIVPIRIDGGASAVELVRPAGVTIRIRIAGGASGLHLDDQQCGAMGGPTALHAGVDVDSPDRYELTIAGASHLTLRGEG
jgi:hypothetical protein